MMMACKRTKHPSVYPYSLARTEMPPHTVRDVNDKSDRSCVARRYNTVREKESRVNNRNLVHSRLSNESPVPDGVPRGCDGKATGVDSGTTGSQD